MNSTIQAQNRAKKRQNRDMVLHSFQNLANAKHRKDKTQTPYCTLSFKLWMFLLKEVCSSRAEQN